MLAQAFDFAGLLGVMVTVLNTDHLKHLVRHCQMYQIQIELFHTTSC